MGIWRNHGRQQQCPRFFLASHQHLIPRLAIDHGFGIEGLSFIAAFLVFISFRMFG